jgi:hypothetical protein
VTALDSENLTSALTPAKPIAGIREQHREVAQHAPSLEVLSNLAIPRCQSARSSAPRLATTQAPSTKGACRHESSLAGSTDGNILKMHRVESRRWASAPALKAWPRVSEGEAGPKISRETNAMWSAAVVVKTGPFRTFHISSLHEALVCLRIDWPRDKRDRLHYRRALKLCEGAANGELKVEIAREAFIAAARDADLLAFQSAVLTGRLT